MLFVKENEYFILYYMAKYRLLTRIGETRDEIKWDYYNVDKYVAPPPTLLNNIINEYELENKLELLNNNEDIHYILHSFKRSIDPPSSDTTTVRIDNDESGTPIYAWISSNEPDFDILYYTEAESIIIDNGNNLFSWPNCRTVDVDIFDTSNVTNMNSMFNNAGVYSLNLSNFNTSSVTNMRSMFNSCSLLNSLDISSFNTTNVTNMSSMFGSCSSLTTLDVSNFNTSNVTNMNYMFQYCNKLTSLDVSNFNTSSVTDMTYMFGYCRKLTTLDLSNFDTSKVTNMSYMFRDCSSLTLLDISNFDTSNVYNMNYMFYNCTSLTTIICTEEIEQWIRNNADAMYLSDNIDNIAFNRP